MEVYRSFLLFIIQLIFYIDDIKIMFPLFILVFTIYFTLYSQEKLLICQHLWLSVLF